MAKQTKLVPAARPFLKWAGGKTQLLNEFSKRLPGEFRKEKITKYVEPFIGGGAVFFYLNQRFSFEECYICDINEELILSYRVIKQSVKKLISELESLESGYLSKSDKKREAFYYEIRDAFNQKLPEIKSKKDHTTRIERVAQIIFLNRTCYNGLFRVNRKGEFNVPFGRYKNPEILNEDNLKDVSTLLKSTKIILGDFTQCQKFVDKHTFVYFDPPYRPLNETSSFTSYSKNGFFEDDQMRLVEFFKELDGKGAKIMLSNSDPKNENPDDSFFDDLFAEYYIERVPAKRMINCNGARRGDINELIITNYRVKKT
ncbi:MAG: DNA adenine methylase [Methanoregula sp.]|uniref:DNA adenine methylase n=1 Tax=Methanoregula sp. TaxID=2052170 RepID=UPI003BB1B1AD